MVLKHALMVTTRTFGGQCPPGCMQGLLYWRGQGHHMVVANRISASSSISPGEPITFVNSVAVAPSGKVYFTSSGTLKDT